MKLYVFYIVLSFATSVSLISQELANIPERTPEQEASTQTERLQRELNLSTEQIKEVYDINLNYARQRQVSNSRSEAMERIKNKNEDLKKVLSNDQYQRLQNKHYQRSTYVQPSGSGNTVIEPAHITGNQSSGRSTLTPGNGVSDRSASGQSYSLPQQNSRNVTRSQEINSPSHRSSGSNAGYYNSRPHSSTSSSMESTRQPHSSRNYNNSRPSSSNRSSGSYSTPSRNNGNNSRSSGNSSSGSSNSKGNSSGTRRY